MSIEERLERLEKSSARYRLLSIILTCALGLMIGMGFTSGNDVKDLVRAYRVQVLDPSDNSVNIDLAGGIQPSFTMGTQDSSSFVSMILQTGGGVFVSAGANKASSFSLIGTGGDIFASINDRKGQAVWTAP
jgi:hypothetical protein